MYTSDLKNIAKSHRLAAKILEDILAEKIPRKEGMEKYLAFTKKWANLACSILKEFREYVER